MQEEETKIDNTPDPLTLMCLRVVAANFHSAFGLVEFKACVC